MLKDFQATDIARLLAEFSISILDVLGRSFALDLWVLRRLPDRYRRLVGHHVGGTSGFETMWGRRSGPEAVKGSVGYSSGLSCQGYM